MLKKIDILGTTYNIRVDSERNNPKLLNANAYVEMWGKANRS